MSRLRVLGVGVLVVAVVLGASACSKDEKKGASSDRPPISFEDPPEGSTDLGLCYAYDLQQMKDLLGGDETFKQLPPAAIGTEDDKVRGNACSWSRTEANGDVLNLRIEARNYGEDTATLQSQFDALKKSTPGATPMPNLGDDAFTSIGDESSLMQIRKGQYLVTLSSRAEGELKPVSINALTLLGATGLAKLP